MEDTPGNGKKFIVGDANLNYRRDNMEIEGVVDNQGFSKTCLMISQKL